MSKIKRAIRTEDGVIGYAVPTKDGGEMFVPATDQEEDMTPEPAQCMCETNQTCWIHHDCRDGDCTHIDGMDYEESN